MKRQEGWYLNGEKHRESRPAWTIYDMYGFPITEEWYLYNREYDKEDWDKVIAYSLNNIMTWMPDVLNDMIISYVL